jgi:hypothetical protein
LKAMSMFKTSFTCNMEEVRMHDSKFREAVHVIVVNLDRALRREENSVTTPACVGY